MELDNARVCIIQFQDQKVYANLSNSNEFLKIVFYCLTQTLNVILTLNSQKQNKKQKCNKKKRKLGNLNLGFNNYFLLINLYFGVRPWVIRFLAKTQPAYVRQ